MELIKLVPNCSDKAQMMVVVVVVVVAGMGVGCSILNDRRESGYVDRV